MPVPPPLRENVLIDADAIVAYPNAEVSRLIDQFGFDASGARVPEGIANRFTRDANTSSRMSGSSGRGSPSRTPGSSAAASLRGS